MEAEVDVRHLPLSLPTLFFETGSHQLARLAGQQAHDTRVMNVCHYTQLFMWVLGIEIRSSCLHESLAFWFLRWALCYLAGLVLQKTKVGGIIIFFCLFLRQCLPVAYAGLELTM